MTLIIPGWRDLEQDQSFRTCVRQRRPEVRRRPTREADGLRPGSHPGCYMKIDRRSPVRTVGLAACVLIAACGQPQRVVDLPMPPRSTGTAVMHAVHSGELREVMQRLRGASFERLPQELDDSSREQAYLQEASSRARDLALEAGRIDAIVDQIGLTADQQQVFLALAERLRTRALELRTQADLRQTRLIHATREEIDETCTGCHTLFRDMPQPPPPDTP